MIRVCIALAVAGASCEARSCRTKDEPTRDASAPTATIDRFQPPDPGASKSPVEQIFAGGSKTCAVLRDKSVKCWGGDDHGSLSGDRTAEICTGEVRCRRAPLPIDFLKDSAAVAFDMTSSCLLGTRGRLACWGGDLRGTLGLGNAPLPTCEGSAGHLRCASKPRDVLEGVTSVSGNTGTFCATTEAGELYCWGTNAWNRLGMKPPPDKCGPKPDCSKKPHRVNGIDDAAQVVVSPKFTAVRRKNGEVLAWGGQIPFMSFLPEPVEGLTKARTIAVVEYAIYALTEDDRLLGYGARGGKPVEELTGVKRIVTGDFHRCALTKKDGLVRCWGFNRRGQLGHGDTEERFDPTVVRGLKDIVSIAAGDQHTCALDKDGNLWCWGSDQYGQLSVSGPRSRCGAVSASDSQAEPCVLEPREVRGL